MASLDSLPGDQRAVLELVLRQGRGYDEIERLLSIDRTAVRARALAALDAVGPATTVDEHRRALIADYLLGQLPPRVSEEVTKRLAGSPDERSWAQALEAELAPIASSPLPAIPAESEGNGVPTAPPSVAPGADPAQRAAPDGEAAGDRPASRRGGAILLAVVALVAIGVVVILLTQTGSPHTSAPPGPVASGTSSTATSTTTGTSNTTAASTATGTSGTAATTTPATTPTQPKILAQVNLLAPGGKSKAKGAAEILSEKSTLAVLLIASGLAANTKHDIYAVWLYSSPSKFVRVGYVQPGVTSNGRVERLGLLPANAANYSRLLLTLEPQPPPSHPGNVVLEGSFKLP